MFADRPAQSGPGRRRAHRTIARAVNDLPDTNVAVKPPSTWTSGRTLQATASAPDGKAVGGASGELRNGLFVLPYARELNDHPVAAYRITVGA